MKAKIVTFSLKGKSYILWEDVNNVKGIREEELIWDEHERIFKKKYLFERYYDDKAKAIYELPMGFMKYYEYNNKFLGLLRYVP